MNSNLSSRGFTSLEKASDFNRRLLPVKADGSLEAHTARPVRKKFSNGVKGRSSLTGFTFLSAVILVALISLSIWFASVLADIILKSKSTENTEAEMNLIKDALRNFYRDCDQFPKDTNDATLDLLDLEGKNGDSSQGAPDVSRFYGPASYRQSKWDGPYIQDKWEDNGYTKDAWNKPYIYDYNYSDSDTDGDGIIDRYECKITSYGPNRVSGGGDDITITVDASDIAQGKIRKTKEELAYINAKKDELETRYKNANHSWPPAGFGIDDLFKTYGCATTGLVSWWKMDEASWNGTAGEVVDSQGSNNGTAGGGATTVFAGKLGRAGSFDGTDDYVEIPDLSAYFSPNRGTIEVWVLHSTSQSGGIGIVAFSDNKPLIYLATNALQVDWAGSTGFPISNTYTNIYNVVGIGAWHHIAFTWDADAGTYSLYCDGVLLESGSGVTFGSMTTDVEAFGEYYGANYLNGLIDEVRIWNRALTSDDVFQEYLRGVYLTDWAYKYDEWEGEYVWSSVDDEFYSAGPDKTAGTSDDIYQSQ